MFKLSRLINRTGSSTSIIASKNKKILFDQDKLFSIPVHHLAKKFSNRFFDFYQLGSKEAIKKERERITDEMRRGYFHDIKELKEHGGKIAVANKTVVPAAAAVKFPILEVNYSDGRTLKLPISSDGNVIDAGNSAIPKASLVCLSFRAHSQAMVDSWSMPFQEAFKDSKDVQLYEISFIDSWLLCRNPIKRLLLRTMRKSNDAENDTLKKQIVYSFGDHYYFRKELKILNLVTGYVFLVDKFGRIRWQGFGASTQEEIESLLSCTTVLSEEK